MRQKRQLAENGLHGRQQRRRYDQRLGPTVGEHVGVLVRIEQRVEQDWHHAGLDGAPEHDRIGVGIEHQHGNARFPANAEGVQKVSHTVAAGRQLTVRQRSGGIDERGFARSALGNVPVHHA